MSRAAWWAAKMAASMEPWRAVAKADWMVAYLVYLLAASTVERLVDMKDASRVLQWAESMAVHSAAQSVSYWAVLKVRTTAAS